MKNRVTKPGLIAMNIWNSMRITNLEKELSQLEEYLFIPQKLDEPFTIDNNSSTTLDIEVSPFPIGEIH
mgnify:CR=1 FL=1